MIAVLTFFFIKQDSGVHCDVTPILTLSAFCRSVLHFLEFLPGLQRMSVFRTADRTLEGIRGDYPSRKDAFFHSFRILTAIHGRSCCFR